LPGELFLLLLGSEFGEEESFRIGNGRAARLDLIQARSLCPTTSWYSSESGHGIVVDVMCVFRWVAFVMVAFVMVAFVMIVFAKIVLVGVKVCVLM
jgi:hypothetical protein